MANRLLTKKEACDMIYAEFLRICDEEGVPEQDRVGLLCAAFAPMFYSPMPGYEPSQKQNER